MDSRIHLIGAPGRPWHRSGSVRATGWAMLGSRRLHGIDLARHVEEDPMPFHEKVKRFSGSFAIVVDTPHGFHAASDRVRSIPLFYGEGSGGTLLSDDARWLAREVNARLDSAAAAAELLLVSCTTGSTTLSSGVHQIQAGEVLSLANGAISTRRYFRYGAGAVLEGDEHEFAEEAVRLFEAAFEALITSVAGQPVAIPLSGGIDSRLIAAMLVRGGRTDAQCFSYGRPSSEESRISRAVARALGLEWDFVPYTSSCWSAWFNTPDFQRFRLNAGGLSTIEHEQDWPAVRTLLDRGFLRPGAVVIPGHCCDFRWRISPPIEDPIGAIWKRYYSEWPTTGISPDLRAVLHTRIDVAIDGLQGIEAYNSFGWQERQSKMIVNSVRVYEDHGLAWRLPLWDGAELLDFWGRLPPELRTGRRLYRRVVRRLIGEVFDLPQARGPAFPLLGKWRRGTDADMRRYGIWMGTAPLLRGLTQRISDLSETDHPILGPVVKQVTGPNENRPPQWATINGLLALTQLRDLANEIG